MKRGGFGEPYCSDNCYNAAGREISGGLFSGIRGQCGFCQREVSVSLGSEVKLIPYRDAFLFICSACRYSATDYVNKIQECCMCKMPLS